MKSTHWKIEGSSGEFIHVTTDEAIQQPIGVVIIGHGFKGYKDYGMFPWLSKQFVTNGFISHRFNYSHSGMLGESGPFERPDLFETDTWNKQVEDLKILIEELKIDGKPIYILGHSRGGVAALLTVGRGAQVDGVISLSAPATCNPLSEEDQKQLLSQGYLDSPSFRTKQMLRIGSCFLQEQLDNPNSHDLLKLASTINTSVLLIHGEDDPTVSVDSSAKINSVLKKGTLTRIKGGDHVFNTPNPFPVSKPPSSQLLEVWEAINSWLEINA
ncbi:MAG: alpha/beta fold hydrolase [Phycisphaerales bacterium]|jgi:pimeloyl-ACP methyl ester carboxylesterase|nr:alpha/beta fold hydrolase [Phycisphaerales bacterium]